MFVPPNNRLRWASAALLGATLEGFFPNYCYLCGLRSYRDQPLCTACQCNLSSNEYCCSRCALPLPGPALQVLPICTERTQLCGQCLNSPPAFDRVIAPWLYDEQLAFLLHRWKFHRERRLSRMFAHLWLSRLNEDPELPDTILPVPLHWSKLWRRGFNQSELLAVALRKQCQVLQTVTLGTGLVQRHRATSAQSRLSAAQRVSNMRGAFTARQRCDNLRIAIVDDVLTTGATASSLATTLRDAGASTIEIWCLARTPEPQH